MPAPKAVNDTADCIKSFPLVADDAPTVFVALLTPNSFCANPLIPFPASPIIPFPNDTTPGATALTALNAIYATNNLGRFCRTIAIISA